MFIDTHTHLYVEQFAHDVNDVIKRSISEGITSFILPSIDSNYTKKMLHLKNKFPERIHLMIGLHPTHVDENFEFELENVFNYLNSKNFIAVGEIGIDLFRDKTKLQLQTDVFYKQIKWAIEFDLPIVIHCREAYEQIFEVLESFDKNKIRGIFHCFTGNEKQAKKIIDFNMFLGIGGILTFKNNNLQKVVKNISLKKIVLETDSPYLAPQPFRGKRNESTYLPIVANRLAEIHRVEISEIAKITTSNAKKIFKI